MNKKYLIQRGIHFFPQVCHLDIEVFICVASNYRCILLPIYLFVIIIIVEGF